MTSATEINQDVSYQMIVEWLANHAMQSCAGPNVVQQDISEYLDQLCADVRANYNDEFEGEGL